MEEEEEEEEEEECKVVELERLREVVEPPLENVGGLSGYFEKKKQSPVRAPGTG